MSSIPLRSAVHLALAASCLAGTVAAGEPPWSDLHWRLAGPHRGGWAISVAGVPGDPATFYFGAADGGVWRTTDAGTTWQPLFDREGSASIGALAVAPSDPRVIWAGTGQIHQRWDIVAGDGVYRSTDGGATWRHLGLTETRHVGDLWVDPRDADVALVAALGHVFGPNEERGLYRTEDGGATWTRVFFRDADTGAASLAGDPAHPDLLYASLWQVRRHPWLDYFQPTVGPGSGVVVSSDGGRSWRAAGTEGWPAAPLGRIELAVIPGSAGRGVWAAVESDEAGGLYRSDDAGASWTRVSDDGQLGSSYMSGLVPDPRDPDALWAMGRSMRRSEDGGRTWTIVKGSPGGDDYHAMWVDPTDPRRRITGADQGAVVTLNDGATWSSWYNQPTGQFYRLGVDDAFPYRIYSGQQDSGTVGIASRSDYGQITFRDWSPVGGDERDGDLPDPTDPDVVYGAGLGGRLSKWNRRTGQVANVSPWPVSSYAARPGTARYRYDWITPIAISPRPPHALYQGAQVLFRSLDGGASWQTVSPDLTGADPDATGCDGDVPVERATACGFGAIFAIAPSPAADGVVWVGTTNGRVQVTRDGGASWTDATPPGLADWSKVNSIDPSPTEAGTAYLAADRHRLDERRPIVWKTTDFGASWREIGSGLPEDEWVGVVRADWQAPGLLFAGTDRGVRVSLDDGGNWQSLQLDLPTTGINDLAVRHDDVIVATQGRAIWILDDVSPLRFLARHPLPELPALAPPAPAVRLRFNQNKDTPLPPEEPRGENPEAGAIVDYWLPEGSDGPVAIEIHDERGALVRRFASDEAPEPPEATVYFTDLWLGAPALPGAGPGHHRFVWDLREPAPRTLESDYSIAAVPGRPTPALPAGAFVLPGRYTVRLSAGGVVRERPLEVGMDPRVDADAATLAALLAFQREVAGALGRAVDLAGAVESAAARLEPLATASAGSDEAATVERARSRLAVARGAGERRASAIAGDLTGLLTDLESADAAPTAAQRALLADALARLADAENRWLEYESETLAPLERRLGADPARLGVSGVVATARARTT
ncbi:MAG TPA: hypothetical protein VLA66_11475 [Thermoanaerobaculia bacterium]|nr:hypothetical protein [Thermoanaerobaculia bacterium]